MIAPSGTRLRRVPLHPSSDVGPTTSGCNVVPARWPSSSSSTRAISQPVHVSGGHRLHRPPSPGANLASPRLVGATDAPFEVPAELGSRSDRSALVTCRSGHWLADVELMQRLIEVPVAPRIATSCRRATTTRSIRRPTCGERNRCPRPTCCRRSICDHAWRQHDHGGSTRQADGALAVVLGSVRQRPASARDRLRVQPSTYAFEDWMIGAAIGCSTTTTCRRGWPRMRR